MHLAKAWTVHRRKPIGSKRDAAAPEGVNYEMWLGPAPLRAFNANRFHYNWHWFWDYGTGELGNWGGCHMLDVARWGLGVELPTRVSAVGGRFHFNDDQETPDTLMVQYAYPGATIVWEHRTLEHARRRGRSAAAAFYGDAGTLVVDRGGWKVYDQSETIASDTSEQSIAHLRNFVDCIKSRSQPVADIETGHIALERPVSPWATSPIASVARSPSTRPRARLRAIAMPTCCSRGPIAAPGRGRRSDATRRSASGKDRARLSRISFPL